MDDADFSATFDPRGSLVGCNGFIGACDSSGSRATARCRWGSRDSKDRKRKTNRCDQCEDACGSSRIYARGLCSSGSRCARNPNRSARVCTNADICFDDANTRICTDASSVDACRRIAATQPSHSRASQKNSHCLVRCTCCDTSQISRGHFASSQSRGAGL